MSASVLPSLLGGAGLALSAHTLLALNGSVFGISSFLHSAVRGARRDAAGVLALVLGGVVVGRLEGGDVPVLRDASVGRLVASGLLAGLGTKLGSGCTSGHMLCGISRFSVRSIAATLTFFVTGALTTRLAHSDLGPVNDASSALSYNDGVLLAGSALSLTAAWLASRTETSPSENALESHTSPNQTRRTAVQFLASLGFALSLRVSRLVDPHRVLSFLALPIHPAFDPALLYLAVGAMPLLTLLYRAQPKRLQSKGGVDLRLLVGAALFGVGWGLDGICPGPGLVNLGHALAVGKDVGAFSAWVLAVAAGGALYG